VTRQLVFAPSPSTTPAAGIQRCAAHLQREVR